MLLMMVCVIMFGTLLVIRYSKLSPAAKLEDCPAPVCGVSDILNSLPEQITQPCRNSYGAGGLKSKPYGFAPNDIFRLRVSLGPDFGMEPCACESPFTCNQSGGWMSSLNLAVCERSVALFNNVTGATYECFQMCNSPPRFFFGSSDRSCSGCYAAVQEANFSKVGLVPDFSDEAHKC